MTSRRRFFATRVLLVFVLGCLSCFEIATPNTKAPDDDGEIESACSVCDAQGALTHPEQRSECVGTPMAHFCGNPETKCLVASQPCSNGNRFAIGGCSPARYEVLAASGAATLPGSCMSCPTYRTADGTTITSRGVKPHAASGDVTTVLGLYRLRADDGSVVEVWGGSVANARTCAKNMVCPDCAFPEVTQ